MRKANEEANRLGGVANQLPTIFEEEEEAENDLETAISNSFRNDVGRAIFRNNRKLTQKKRRYGTLNLEGAKTS